MRAATRKLTTAAVCTALAVIMCAFTKLQWFSFMPLYVAAFCIFLAFKRGNIVYGFLCTLATAGILFAMTGLTLPWFIFVVMFAPYGILTYFMHRFDYFRVKNGLIRGAVMVAFFNMTMGFLYLIATRVLFGGGIKDGIDIVGWVDTLGGYWVFAIVGTLILMPLDFMFVAGAKLVLKKLPGGAAERRKPGAPAPDAPGDDGGGRFDIFGYEITDGPPGENTDAPEPAPTETEKDGDGGENGGDKP